MIEMLREVGFELLEEAERLYLRAKPMPVVQAAKRIGCYEVFIVGSERQYKVVKFGQFWFSCECRGFRHRKTCKHLPATYEASCVKCRVRAAQRGEMCGWCEPEHALYLKETEERDGEKIGGIVI